MQKSAVQNIPIPSSNKFTEQHLLRVQLNDLYLIFQPEFKIQHYYCHTGIDKQKLRQLVIISQNLKSGKKMIQTNYKESVPSLVMLWSGVQLVKKSKYIFKVYLKQGISLHQYLKLFKNHLKPHQLHFILKILMELIVRIHQNEMVLEYLDLRLLMLVESQQQCQKLVVKVLDLNMFKKNMWKNKYNQGQKQTQQNVQLIAKNTKNMQYRCTSSSRTVYHSDIKLVYHLILKYFSTISRMELDSHLVESEFLILVLEFIEKQMEENETGRDMGEKIFKYEEEIIKIMRTKIQNAEKQAIEIINNERNMKENEIRQLMSKELKVLKCRHRVFEQFQEVDVNINENVRKYVLNPKQNWLNERAVQKEGNRKSINDENILEISQIQ